MGDSIELSFSDLTLTFWDETELIDEPNAIAAYGP